jgi:hypothetical protein
VEIRGAYDENSQKMELDDWTISPDLQKLVQLALQDNFTITPQFITLFMRVI